MKAVLKSGKVISGRLAQTFVNRSLATELEVEKLLDKKKGSESKTEAEPKKKGFFNRKS